jgi:hypothetical protein
MKKMMLIGVVALAIAGAVAVHANQSHAATAEAPIVPGLTASNYAKAGFVLVPAHDSSPAIDSARALALAANFDPGKKVLGSALGYCDLSVSGLPSRDCYVVSFDPTGQVVHIYGGIQYKGPDSTPMVAAGVLIDAATGDQIFSWQQGAPTN